MKWYFMIAVPLSTAFGYSLHEHPWYTVLLSCIGLNLVFMALYCAGYWNGVTDRD